MTDDSVPVPVFAAVGSEDRTTFVSASIAARSKREAGT
jgi:hypothetical protein